MWIGKTVVGMMAPWGKMQLARVHLEGRKDRVHMCACTRVCVLLGGTTGNPLICGLDLCSLLTPKEPEEEQARR